MRELRIVLNVLNGVADTADFFSVVIADFNVELLFKGHDQLNDVEGVGSKAVAAFLVFLPFF